MTPPPIEVVFQAPVLVGALSEIGPSALTFPAVPPLSGQHHADALGVFAYPDTHFALSLSEDIVEEVVTALTSAVLGWEYEEAEAAIGAVGESASRAGGGLIAPENDVEVPERFSRTAATALRAACSKDLGHPRVLVTDELAVLRTGNLYPQSIPFPPSEDIQMMNPERLSKMAEKVRWRMRRSP